jgi:A/G-specific adenine glycosylase
MSNVNELIAIVARHYESNGRHDLPWRMPEADEIILDPYKIMVSEIMLQQTQVSRVIPKFRAFLDQFPSVDMLAAASLGDVLIAWQGLGYNRRAKFLWQAVQKIVNEYGGVFPTNQTTLTQLPGIGINTAGAIMAYAYNVPDVFIETNIRTVYIHHFFVNQNNIADKDILRLLRETLRQLEEHKQWFLKDGTVSYRAFYWALMDYGTYVKATEGNAAARASRSYAKQSHFQGSRRQLRGIALHALTMKAYSAVELANLLDDPRASEVLSALINEGLIKETAQVYRLS